MFSDDMKFVQKAVVFHPVEKTKFLILKRSEHDHWRAGEWDLPGGNVHFGELHDDSLRKEIKEEADLEVGDLTPLHVKTDFNRQQGYYYIAIKYMCTATSEKVHVGDEHTAYRWVTKEEFKELDTANFLPEIKDAFVNL